MVGSRRTATRLAGLWLLALVLLASSIDWLPLPDPITPDLTSALSAPTPRHMAGTDELGRDVLSRILHAARATLVVVVGATSMSLLIALVLGGVAGYVGGFFDAVVRLAIDVLWSVPFVIFVVLIISIAGVSTLSLIVTIGLLNWVGAARIVRGETARLRDSEFIFAARAHGYSQTTILARELLPNLKRTVLTLAAYSAIEVLTLETGLAFLGLSLPAPKPTWGGMLADGLSYFSTAWWIVAAACVVITTTLASLQIVAGAFQEHR
jgi:peptide/nickel transport system permease protein